MLRKHNYSRGPVLDEAGDVVGILDVYDVLVDEPVAIPAERMTAPLKLPADMTVTEALYAMRRGRHMMAVAQKDGKAVGIVTIKDLVEEIVGELEEW
jgi:CBS domain containing-hemolysin-like protein